MQNWIYLAFLAAIIGSLSNVSMRDVGLKVDEYTAGFMRNLLGLPFFWLFLLLSGMPYVDYHFWILVLVSLPFEITLTILLQKAFKYSEASLVVPILSFSPIFIGFFSYLIFREALSIKSLIALLFLVIGAYFLNYERGDLRNIFNPFKNLIKDRGSFYMLLVTVILGFTVTMGKRAIVYSSPQFFSAIYYTLLTLILFPITLVKSRNSFKQIQSHIKTITLLGLLNAGSSLTGFFAFSTGPTALVQGVISTRTLFTVLFGGAFLKEKGITKRLIASLIMVTGTLLIILK